MQRETNEMQNPLCQLQNKGAKDKSPQSKSNASHVVVASVMSTHSAYTRMPTVATLKIYEH